MGAIGHAEAHGGAEELVNGVEVAASDSTLEDVGRQVHDVGASSLRGRVPVVEDLAISRRRGRQYDDERRTLCAPHALSMVSTYATQTKDHTLDSFEAIRPAPRDATRNDRPIWRPGDPLGRGRRRRRGRVDGCEVVRAGQLLGRTRAGSEHAVDAFVVAVADVSGGGIIATTGPKNMTRLGSHADRVTIADIT